MAQQPQRQKKPVPALRIIGIVLAVIIASGCGIGWLNLLLNPAPNPRFIIQFGDQPTDPAAPVIHAIYAPTVGGTIADFQQQYGSATDGSGQIYVATVAGKRVRIMLTLGVPNEKIDNESHVIIVDVQAINGALGGETWSAATADQIAKTFLPTDAQFQFTATTNGGHKHIYYSEAMAATFMPDQFTNDVGNASPSVGIVSYTCHALPTSRYDQCRIIIGSN